MYEKFNELIESFEFLYDLQIKNNLKNWNAIGYVEEREKLRLHIEYVLGMYHNTNKLLNDFGWNKQLIEIKEVDKHSIGDNIGDVIKYIFSLMILHEIDIGDFVTLYLEKYEITNIKIAEQKRKLKKEMKVAAFDLDGVIFDYTSEYIKLARHYGHFKGIDNLKESHTSYSFYSSFNKFGFTLQDEREIFEMFVKGGNFRSLKTFKDSVSVVNKLKSMGYVIVLITARPNKRYKNVYSDTVFSLIKNNISFDKLLFFDNKADAIQSLAPADVVFMVEDRDKHALEVSSIGTKVFLVDKTYNRTILANKRIERINNLSEILNKIGEKNGS